MWSFPGTTIPRYPASMEAVQTKTRDGRHDFDFLIGSWNVHNRRLKAPLTGSNEWYEFEGWSEARSLWGGKGNMDEFSAESPLGRIEGFTLRCYDPGTGLWSLYWANAKTGLLPVPNVGAFGEDGVGDFFCDEVIAGKAVICRYHWIKEYQGGCRWEQAFSVDGGTTWETNWTMHSTPR